MTCSKVHVSWCLFVQGPGVKFCHLSYFWYLPLAAIGPNTTWLFTRDTISRVIFGPVVAWGRYQTEKRHKTDLKGYTVFSDVPACLSSRVFWSELGPQAESRPEGNIASHVERLTPGHCCCHHILQPSNPIIKEGAWLDPCLVRELKSRDCQSHVAFAGLPLLLAQLPVYLRTNVTDDMCKRTDDNVLLYNLYVKNHHTDFYWKLLQICTNVWTKKKNRIPKPFCLTEIKHVWCIIS